MTRRLLTVLLRLAPRSFREDHGDELLQVHAERLRSHPRGPRRFWFGIRECAGILRMILALRSDTSSLGSPSSTPGWTAMFEALRQDLRIAARGLRRQPGFALTAILVLALGIGANTAIFSAANAFFFRPLPFADADRLVLLYETNPEFGWTQEVAAPANVLDWQEQVEAFEAIAMYSTSPGRATWIGEDGEARLLDTSSVTGNFFDVLGVAPALGRTLRSHETWAPDHRVVVLGHALWASGFGADPGVVGRVITLGDTTFEVVGVMPAGFTFPTSTTQMWTPWGWDPAVRSQVWFRRAHWVTPVARLRPGASAGDAAAQLEVVVQRLSRDHPETNRVMGAGFLPLRESMTQDVRAPLLVLAAAVATLLLLACTNVANLLLLRATGRSREISVRSALGAGRGRIIRLMLTESLLLATVGGGLGLWLGWTGIRLMETFQPLGIDGATALTLDGRVVLFVVLVSLTSGTLLGLLPAIRSASGRIHERLKEGGRGGSEGPSRSRLVDLLVGAEVALALLLVVSAGLMTRSFLLLRDVDPGFRVANTVGIQFQIPESRYPERDQVLAFQDAFLRAAAGRPEVVSAGVVGALPLAGRSWSSQFQAEGWPPERAGFEILHRAADAGYFDALDIPLVEGRMFGAGDDADSPPVILVNETFARTHFPGESPVGRRIAYDQAANENPDDHRWFEIVGVVGDQRQDGLAGPVRPEVFEHRDQDWGRSRWIVIHTAGHPASAVPLLRDVLRELDPAIPLADARPLREVWQNSLAREQFLLALFGVFGVVALLVAAVGVYGVTSQAARTRTREIGIRMALGASGSAVVWMMLRQGLSVVLLGLVVGLAAALLSGGILSGLLYEVEPSDPRTLSAVVALLGGVAALACYLPARRATSRDPLRSLREE